MFSTKHAIDFPIIGGSTTYISRLIIILLALLFLLFISGTLWNSVIPGGWSIQAEVISYISFPVLRKLTLNALLTFLILLNLFTIFSNWVARNLIVSSVFMSRLLEIWNRISLSSTIGFFAIGMIYFRYTNLGREEKSILRVKKITPALIIFFLLSWIQTPCPFGNSIEALAFVFAMYLFATILIKVKFISKIIALIGKYSYFIYFAHFLVISLILPKFLSNIQRAQMSLSVRFIILYFTTVIISFAMAIPSYKFLEKPLLDFARR